MSQAFLVPALDFAYTNAPVGQIVADNDSPTIGDTIILTWIDWGVYGTIIATPDSLAIGDSTSLEFVPVTLTYQWISGIDGSNLSGETTNITNVLITAIDQVMPKLRVTNSVSNQSKVFNAPTIDISPAPPIETPSNLLYALTTHSQEISVDKFVPTGLYTDTAGTIPATTEGDLIARWDDTLTASGISLRQATESKRPVLQFEENNIGILVPVVYFDGVDDELVSVANIALWTAKRGAFYARFFGQGTQRNPISWGTSATMYTSYTSRFFDGGFVGTDTGTDYDVVQAAIIRTTDTNRDYYLNEDLQNSTAGGNSATISASFILGQFGGFYWNGQIQSILYSDIGTYDIDANSFMSGIGVKTKTIACDGNSLTIGTGGSSPYPAQLSVLLGNRWMVRNFGVGAQTTAAMISDAAAQIDTIFDNSTKKVVVCWEGTNDLFFGATATAAYNRLVQYCQERQSAGLQVVIATILPRSDTSTPGSFETDRQTINTNIRANWATYADALADVAADTRIGDAGDELNTTYYTADKVHMNDTGYGVVAEIIKTAIETL